MDLIRHLELFEAVASEGHFGRAAELLGMAQPPLSQAIRRLEKELGCVLFERTSSGAVLTPAGSRVREAADRARRAASEVRAAAAAEARAPVRLLVEPSLPSAWSAALVLDAEAGGLAIELEPAPTEEALQRARSGDLPAVVLAPFRAEGLRTGGAAPCRLWEARPEQPLSSTTALVHERAPTAFLGRLARELRGLAIGVDLVPMPRSTALGRLAAGRVHAVISTEEPQLPAALSSRVHVRPLPLEQAAAVFHAVVRRGARDRAVLAVHEHVTATLARVRDV